MRNITTENFITRANTIHNNRYDYTKVNIKNTTTKIFIICSKHGEFEQTPKLHLNGAGCYNCGRESTKLGILKTTDYFIKKSKEIHGDRYDYSKSDYIGAQKNIIIICHKHGEFQQQPLNHTNGAGCPECGGVKRVTTKEFIKKSIKIHGNLYDYTQVKYVSSYKKVKIICKKHGEFLQNYVLHIHQQSGCPKCVHTVIPTTKEFIKSAKYLHGSTYDYTNTVYVQSKTKLKISCKKHGEFLQTPNAHLRGQGCPKCRRSHGETQIAKFLTDNNINFIEQKRFSKCKRIRPLPFDFYLPDNQICIEFDGDQHKKAYKFFGGDDRFVIQQENDKIKSGFCRENNIQLIRITGLDVDLSFILSQLD